MFTECFKGGNVKLRVTAFRVFGAASVTSFSQKHLKTGQHVHVGHKKDRSQDDDSRSLRDYQEEIQRTKFYR